MQKLDVRQTALEDVLVIVPPTIFEDYRGLYIETYNEKLYNKAPAGHMGSPKNPNTL